MLGNNAARFYVVPCSNSSSRSCSRFKKKILYNFLGIYI